MRTKHPHPHFYILFLTWKGMNFSCHFYSKQKIRKAEACNIQLNKRQKWTYFIWQWKSKARLICKLAVLVWLPALCIYGFNLWTSFHKVLLNPHFPYLGPLPGSGLWWWQLALLPVASSALETAEPLNEQTLPLRELWITCPAAAEKGDQKEWQPSIPPRSQNKRMSRIKACQILILINYTGTPKTRNWLRLIFKPIMEFIFYFYFWAIT